MTAEEQQEMWGVKNVKRYAANSGGQLNKGLLR